MDTRFCTLLLLYLSGTGITIEYEQTSAMNALYYAYGAYCNKLSLIEWDCIYCEYVSNFKVANNGVIAGNDLQAFTGYDPDNDRIILSFRGTANIENWLQDFDFIQTEYPYASSVEYPYVHKGFYDAWTDLQEDGLRDAIIDMIQTYNSAPILVTGHSLGGALAQVAALALKSSPVYTNYTSSSFKVNVITFGSPRWCTESLAEYWSNTMDYHWRIVNGHDIVPTVPWRYLGEYDYLHSATEIRYYDTEDLQYVECNVTSNNECDYFGYSISDHLNYLGQTLEDCGGNVTLQTPEPSWPVSINMTESPSQNKSKSSSGSTGRIIVYKVEHALSNVTKIALSVTLAIGWLLAFICTCCYCKTRRDLIRLQGGTRRYFPLHQV